MLEAPKLLSSHADLDFLKAVTRPKLDALGPALKLLFSTESCRHIDFSRVRHGETSQSLITYLSVGESVGVAASLTFVVLIALSAFSNLSSDRVECMVRKL